MNDVPYTSEVYCEVERIDGALLHYALCGILVASLMVIPHTGLSVDEEDSVVSRSLCWQSLVVRPFEMR